MHLFCLMTSKKFAVRDDTENLIVRPVPPKLGQGNRSLGQGVEFLGRPKENGQGGTDLAVEFGRDVGFEEIPY